MLPPPWRACNKIPRWNGSVSEWLWGLLATPILKKYRLSDGCPINNQADIHFDSPNILLTLLPHSTVHLLSRCHISNPKDSRPHLV